MASEEMAGGYWRAVAEDFISAQATKPLFGRPYLKLGQCFGLWVYLVDLGGMLEAKHHSKLDAFVSAFLGMSGEAGAAFEFLFELAGRLEHQYPVFGMRTSDFVGEELGDRVSSYKSDDWTSLVMKWGTEKIPPDVAAKNGWFYARYGAALGVLGAAEGMWERSHGEISKEEWQQAHAAGLDIGPEPPAPRSHEQATEEENKNFREYCRQFHPDLYQILKG
jgi:hypothetical protein